MLPARRFLPSLSLLAAFEAAARHLVLDVAQQSLGRGLGADGSAVIICPSRMPSPTESWAVLQARSAYTGRTSSVPARRTQVSEHCNGARRLIPAGS